MKKLGFLILLSTTLFACNKIDAPSCIRNKTKEYEKDPPCESKASVKKYLFQDANVYVFFPGYCIADGTSNVYDEECNVIGYLGGIAGNTVINGEDFGNAKLLETLWSN